MTIEVLNISIGKCNEEFNMSVIRSTIQGINIHSIHKGEVLVFFSVHI